MHLLLSKSTNSTPNCKLLPTKMLPPPLTRLVSTVSFHSFQSSFPPPTRTPPVPEASGITKSSQLYMNESKLIRWFPRSGGMLLDDELLFTFPSNHAEHSRMYQLHVEHAPNDRANDTTETSQEHNGYPITPCPKQTWSKQNIHANETQTALAANHRLQTQLYANQSPSVHPNCLY